MQWLKGDCRVKKITIQKERCTACKACELACSFTKEGAFVPRLSRIHIERDLEEGSNSPIMCQHCEDAPCMDACPWGALQRLGDPDRIVCDEKECQGCFACVSACPFKAVRFDSERILKCDLCDGEPACVSNCMHGAIQYNRPLVIHGGDKE
jgi:anaerobic carbon-monoxide dehydrogenase iron sulfur subunit